MPSRQECHCGRSELRALNAGLLPRRLLVALRHLARGATSRELQDVLGVKAEAVCRLVAQLEAVGLRVDRQCDAQHRPGRRVIQYTVARSEVEAWLWDRAITGNERVAYCAGHATMRGSLPFGTLDDGEQQTIVMMRALQAVGHGPTEIARRLNAERRPTRHGGVWLPSVVLTILRRTE